MIETFILIYFLYVLQQPAAFPDLSRGLFVETNSVRENKLVWNDCLAEKAVARARDMNDRDYFSHTDPDTGDMPFNVIIPQCLDDWTRIGENLTKDFKTVDDAQAALINSPTHLKNILGDYREMGVGCFEEYCVEFFAN